MESCNLRIDGWVGVIIFACSTIIMPPLAEELFFRKNIIYDSSKTIFIITSIMSIFLYSVEHSFTWLGILETVFIAIPFTLSYIKTKDIYIVITAHFIINLIGNLPSVIISIVNLL
ncbi:MAG: lysostaphin resistance A-like protein [Lachnotalea sp.]